MNRLESEKRVATGIFVRKTKSGAKSIRLVFSYRNRLYREALKLNPTQKNIRKIIALRKKILEKITLNQFNYGDFFPHSKNAARLGHSPKKILIKELLNKFLERSKKCKEDSTYNRYSRICKGHLLPNFGEMAVQELTPMKIWDWLEKINCQKKQSLIY